MFDFIKRFITLRKIRKQSEDVRFNEKIWNYQKPLIKKQNDLDSEKKELISERRKIKLPSWGKMFLIFLFLNFTVLEFFVGWVTVSSFSLAFTMGIMPDFTPLVTLIGLVVGETISYGCYSSKSKAENTSGGIVYEAAMRTYEDTLDEDTSAKG